MAQFDLVNITDSTAIVAQVKQHLAKATGQQIIAFIANKLKKQAGESTKELDFVLENGQTVTLVVRTDGDVVRVKLNKKDLPLKNELFALNFETFKAITPVMTSHLLGTGVRANHQVGMVKAIEEIAARVRANQAAFDKRRAKEDSGIEKAIKARAGSGSGSVASQTKAKRTNISGLDEQIARKTALRDDLKQKVEQRKIQQDQLNTGVMPA